MPSKFLDRHTKPPTPSGIETDAIPPISSQAETKAETTAETTTLTKDLPETNGASSSPSKEPLSPTSITNNAPTTQTTPGKPGATPPRPPATKRPSGTTVLTHVKPPPKGPQQKSGQRRNSWISNLSSKFTSNPGSNLGPVLTPAGKEQLNDAKPARASPQFESPNPFGAAYSPGTKENEKKDGSPYVPAPPKNPSFLQNALRRLSSSSPSTLGRGMSGSNSICERKVMNIDPNRDRVKVEEFDQAKLRRVSFCVDVEIAGFARYLEPEPETEKASPSGRRPSLQALEQASNAKKAKDKKLKEMGEGAALKNPQLAVTKKEDPFAWDAEKEEGITPGDKKLKGQGEGAALKNPKREDPFSWDAEKEEEAKERAIQAKKEKEQEQKEQEKQQEKEQREQKEQEKQQEKEQLKEESAETNGTNGDDMPNAEDHVPRPKDIDGKGATKKKEKKKRTEEERKARKDRKKKHAEESGKIPLELLRDESDWESTPAGTPPGATTPNGPRNAPTTNPLRIYRRCCQLRETPVLKKIADQISAPTATLVDSPGTVASLDLSNCLMAPSDLNTLADWLAVVPVRKLILENCSLTDETLRIILAGVLAVKTTEQSKFNRQLMKKTNGQIAPAEEKLGVIEKISLKNNDQIGPEGWKYIGLFMHLSRSIKSIDVSMIPFPPAPPAPAEHHHHHHHHNPSVGSVGGEEKPQAKRDICTVISNGLAKRYGGNKLEELIMGECSLGSNHVGQLIDGAIKCGLRRFGLANNNIDQEGVEHVVKYLKSGLCEGLDLGGNKINDHLQLLGDALDDKNPLSTLSLADCGLSPAALANLMPSFVKLPNFRFVDLSHNRELFSKQPDALSMLRKYLPQLKYLKRIHLADVDLTPDHAIAIAEVLPECSSLCHLSLTDNTRLAELAKGGDPESQQEACAMYAALMSAVRVSTTIIAVDIEVPAPESSEVVKAIAKQVVAYSLRNMERGPCSDTYLGAAAAPILDHDTSEKLDVAPDILLQLVGHIDGYDENYDTDAPAPDENYVTAGTGLVKALGVCLGTAEYPSRDISPTGSGAVTPSHPRVPKPERSRKAKDMSRNLLDSARKIKARLQPALLKEDQAGDEMNYRKLYQTPTLKALH
jgi:hypothetical protein